VYIPEMLVSIEVSPLGPFIVVTITEPSSVDAPWSV